MSEFKEFQGKNLDEAIQVACDYYEVPRAKLEIEIVSGGSTGIFGLVGVRKASVKARPRRGVKPATSEEAPQEQHQPAGRERSEHDVPAQPIASPKETPQERVSAPKAEPQTEDNTAPADTVDGSQGQNANSRGSRSRRGRRPRSDKPRQDNSVQESSDSTIPASSATEMQPAEKPVAEKSGRRAPKMEAPKRPPRRPVHEANPAPIPVDRDEVPDFPPDDADDDMVSNEQNVSRGPSLEGLDQDKLREVAREAATELLKNLTPEPKLQVFIESDRVHVLIDDEEHSGLIIGREGQTLSALQYLVNRIVSRRMETSVRVQLDTGDYRERQDDKLRLQARRLAEKAISSHRTQSTKPLSSYHRRVVHLTVQEMTGVLTRSKGEGPLKRVLIVPKKRSR